MWISNENRVSWILTISRILQFMGGLKHCWIHKNREWLKLEGTSNITLSNLLLMQDHLESVSQEFVWNFQGDFSTSLGNLCQCLATLTEKKRSLTFRWNCLCLGPFASLNTTGKSLPLSSLHPPFRYPYTLMRSSLNSPPGWTVPAISALSHNREASGP